MQGTIILIIYRPPKKLGSKLKLFEFENWAPKHYCNCLKVKQIGRCISWLQELIAKGQQLGLIRQNWADDWIELGGKMAMQITVLRLHFSILAQISNFGKIRARQGEKRKRNKNPNQQQFAQKNKNPKFPSLFSGN